MTNQQETNEPRKYSNPIVYYLKNCSSADVWNESTKKIDQNFLINKGIRILEDLEEAPRDCTITQNGTGVFLCPRPESCLSSRIPKGPNDEEWEYQDHDGFGLMIFRERDFNPEDLYRLNMVDTKVFDSGLAIPIARSASRSSIPVELAFDENDQPVRKRCEEGIYNKIWKHGEYLFDNFAPGLGEDPGRFTLSDDELIQSALKIIGFTMRIGPKEFNLLRNGRFTLLENDIFLINYAFIDASSIEKKS